MIKLMDILLQEVNLDFKFTPYKVIATSKEQGFMECVQNSISV